MGYRIGLINGSDIKEGDEYAYRILGNGVLQSIKLNPEMDEGIITAEYSPSAWHAVSGTRLVHDATELPGSEGVYIGGVLDKPTWS